MCQLSQIPILWCWKILTSPTSWSVEPASKSSSRGTKGCFLLRHFKRLHWGPILSNGLAQIAILNYFWGLILSNNHAQLIWNLILSNSHPQLSLQVSGVVPLCLTSLERKGLLQVSTLYMKGLQEIGIWSVLASKYYKRPGSRLTPLLLRRGLGFPNRRFEMSYLSSFLALESFNSLLKYLDQSTVHPPPTMRIVWCYTRR